MFKLAKAAVKAAGGVNGGIYNGLSEILKILRLQAVKDYYGAASNNKNIQYNNPDEIAKIDNNVELEK